MPKLTVAERVTAMLRIRRFEEQCIRLSKEGQFPGHYHVYIGQEPTAVAACAALAAEDFVFSTWRNHGHLLARGAAADRMMAEILGKAGGYAGGRSGTLHLSVRELGVPATSALVGASLPLATGGALACKRRGSGVTVVFFGDAALEEGAFYEAMIIAAVWKLPILFVCENNSIPPAQRKRGQYTSSTLPAARLADVPQSLQIATEVVDGAAGFERPLFHRHGDEHLTAAPDLVHDRGQEASVIRGERVPRSAHVTRRGLSRKRS